MAKKKSKKKVSNPKAAKVKNKRVDRRTKIVALRTKKPGRTLAVIALIINLFFPGLGTMIGGKSKIGAIQMIVFAVGVSLSYINNVYYIGYLLAFGTWLWSMITAITLISEAQ